MKKKYSYIFLLLFLAACNTSYSQQPFLTIYYADSEKGKDSHSTIENISVTGTSVTYSVKYTGRRGTDQKDEIKKCTLSSGQISKIKNTISEKKLNVTDSLIDNSLAENSYQVTTSITITVTSGNKTTKTKVRGTPSVITGKSLYKNSSYLLNMVKEMLESCR